MEENRKFWIIGLLCLAIAIAYFVIPIDMIPDIIAGIGWLDDLVIGLLGLAGIVVNVLWGLGILPAPGSNYQDAYSYQDEYGEYREV